MLKQERERLVNWGLLGAYILKVVNFLKWPATLLAGIILAVTIANSNLSVNHDLVLRYIDALKWPLIALLVILLLRPYIPNLMDRIRELGVGSSKVKFDPTRPQGKTSAAELKDVDEETGEPATSSDDTPNNDELHSILTSPQAVAAYEQTYREIFGTQLEVLKRLMTYLDGLSGGDLKDIYDEHIRKVKELGGEPYQSLISFMKYLRDNSLVLYEPDTRVYKLTNTGYYFLRYLSEQGLLDRAKEL